MKLIQMLEDMIEDELEGAEHYAKKAVKLKDTQPDLAKTLYEISTEEMRHINMLHEQATRLIEQHRKEHGAPPAAMLAVYDYLHGKHIEKANQIKMYQGQYRGT